MTGPAACQPDDRRAADLFAGDADLRAYGTDGRLISGNQTAVPSSGISLHPRNPRMPLVRAIAAALRPPAGDRLAAKSP